MSAIELTPVERNALFALMAAGGPLKESSELRGVYGVSVAKKHRARLQGLGLIETIKKPRLTHNLSEKGWQWAKDQIAASPGKVQTGMTGLYAVLAGLRRHMDRHGYRLEDIFGKSAPNARRDSKQHLHEASWSEADEALSQALQDIPILTKAIDTLQQASTKELNGLVKRTSGAAKLVAQSVRHAGQKRELSLATEPGSETTFDPVMHRSDDDPQPGDRVRVRKPPVVRGSSTTRVVVLLGEVEPV